MSITIRNVKLIRVTTKYRKWSKQKEKWEDLKKPQEKTEVIGTYNFYELENFLKTMFNHTDQVMREGYMGDEKVTIRCISDWEDQVDY